MIPERVVAQPVPEQSLMSGCDSRCTQVTSTSMWTPSWNKLVIAKKKWTRDRKNGRVIAWLKKQMRLGGDPRQNAPEDKEEGEACNLLKECPFSREEKRRLRSTRGASGGGREARRRKRESAPMISDFAEREGRTLTHSSRPGVQMIWRPTLEDALSARESMRWAASPSATPGILDVEYWVRSETVFPGVLSSSRFLATSNAARWSAAVIRR
jgi:hypothetical protein